MKELKRKRKRNPITYFNDYLGAEMIKIESRLEGGFDFWILKSDYDEAVKNYDNEDMDWREFHLKYGIFREDVYFNNYKTT